MSLSFKDPGQILQDIYDEASHALNVNANLVITTIVISDANDSIKIGTGDGATFLKINADRSLNSNTLNTLVKVPYDEIDADYSGSDFDVYTYKLLTVTVATVTVTWTSSAKATLLKIVVS